MMLALLFAILVADARPAPHPMPEPGVALPTESDVLRSLPPVTESPLKTSRKVVEPPGLPGEIEAPRLVVHKSRREIHLLSGDEVLRTYRIALGLEPVRPNQRQGDYATPEGTYYVCTKNPQSKYELSLGLSYPSPADAERGLSTGLISKAEHDQIVAAWNARTRPPWNTKLGGEIMIHGAGSGWDWTWGCVALNGRDIEELYRVVPLGTTVTILP
jgi:hypothetical protein